MANLHRPHAGLLLIRDEKRLMIHLSKASTLIGSKLADIILEDDVASDSHAEIRHEGKKYFLKDLKSVSGTKVNQQRIDEVQLIDQDVIEIGATTLCFFENADDFKGEIEEVSKRVHVKPQELPETDEYTVKTSKTLSTPSVKIHIISGPDEGKKFTFIKPHITIGRNETDIVLLDVDSSRKHAMLDVLGKSSVFVRDLGSTNGTYLNGKKISAEKVESGATIKIGNSELSILIS